MQVWIVTAYKKDTEEIDEVSEPYISAEHAMKDWPFNGLEWKHIQLSKLGGVLLEYWQAESELYDFVLESYHVVGTE